MRRVFRIVSVVLVVLAFMMQVLPSDIPTHLCAWFVPGNCPNWFLALPVRSYVPYLLYSAGFCVFFAPAIGRLWKNNRLIWQRRLQRHMHLLPIICIALGGLVLLSSVVWVCLEQYRVNRDVERSLNRYVLPRHLTEKQGAAIADYLKGFEPQTARILVAKGSKEANGYADDFSEALKQGGWTVTSIDQCIDAAQRIKYSPEKLDATLNDWCEHVPEGISTAFFQAESVKIDPQLPTPNGLFKQALQKAGINADIDHGGGESATATANLFVIRIGTRRTDDFDLKAKEIRAQMRARQKAEDEND
jgi:hypothetical protein